jgi:hypothetical protein
VWGALRRAHAHPNRLVHPHLLAVAYLQSGVPANCRPGEKGENQLPKVIDGVRFKHAIEVNTVDAKNAA